MIIVIIMMMQGGSVVNSSNKCLLYWVNKYQMAFLKWLFVIYKILLLFRKESALRTHLACSLSHLVWLVPHQTILNGQHDTKWQNYKIESEAQNSKPSVFIRTSLCLSEVFHAPPNTTSTLWCSQTCRLRWKRPVEVYWQWESWERSAHVRAQTHIHSDGEISIEG